MLITKRPQAKAIVNEIDKQINESNNYFKYNYYCTVKEIYETTVRVAFEKDFPDIVMPISGFTQALRLPVKKGDKGIALSVKKEDSELNLSHFVFVPISTDLSEQDKENLTLVGAMLSDTYYKTTPSMLFEFFATLITLYNNHTHLVGVTVSDPPIPQIVSNNSCKEV